MPTLGVLGGAVVVVGVIAIGTSYRNASNLNSGTLSNDRLNSSISRLSKPDVTFRGLLAANAFSGNLIGDVIGNLNGNASTATAFANQPSGCDTGSFANSIDRRGNLGCSNDGRGLANLNASSLTGGTVADTRLSSNVAKLDALAQVFKGTITAAGFNGNFSGNISGNATGFTGSLAGDVTGTQGATVVSHVSDSALSANIAKYNDANPAFANLLTANGFSDGTFSVSGGVITGASGNISQWTNDVGYLTSESDPIYSANAFATGMDQGVASTDSPTFAGLTLNGNLDMSTNAIQNATGLISQWTNDTGYLTSFTETDPIYSANTFATGMDQGVAATDSPTFAGLTLSGNLDMSTNAIQNATGLISQWTNDTGYLTSFTETDPVYSANTFATGMDQGVATTDSPTFSGLTVSNPISGSVTGSAGSTTGNAATATKLETARTIGGVSFDGSANITVASATGGFTVSGGDLALGANNLSLAGSIASSSSRVTKGWFSDLDVSNTITGSVSGNAGTATKLQTARSINGTSFDGTADITVTADAGTLTGTTLNSTVVSSSLTSVGTLTDLTVTNPISGSVTGSSGSTTGNAGTATKLQTARNINGVAFDGTGNITVTADASTLTGTVLNSTVLTSSLTSVGTLTDLSVTNPITGSVTGSSGSTSGNAGTATKLQTARTIGGVSFDGSANITVASATGGFTVSGGNLALGTNSLTLTGDIASLASPVGNAWITNLNSTNVAITGGTIDGTVIGGTTPAAVHATSLSSSGTYTATGDVDLHSALSLTVPMTSTDLSGGVVCIAGQKGEIVFSTFDNKFYGCNGSSFTAF